MPRPTAWSSRAAPWSSISASQAPSLPEPENGIEFYRIGRDLIHQLVESAVGETEPCIPPTPERRRRGCRVTQELHRRRALAPSVPTYDTAAFLSPVRERTLGWGLDHSLFLSPAGACRMPRKDQATTTAEPPLPEPTPVPALRPGTPPVEAMEPATEAAPALAERRHDSAPLPAPIEVEKAEPPAPCDIMLGVTGPSPQYGVLGEVAGRRWPSTSTKPTPSACLASRAAASATRWAPSRRWHPWRSPASTVAAAVGHRHLPLQPDDGLSARIHLDGRAQQRRRPGALSFAKLRRPTPGADRYAAPGSRRQARWNATPSTRCRSSTAAVRRRRAQAGHWRFLMGAVGNQAITFGS